MLKIGIVGCGAIGKTLAHAIERDFYPKACVFSLYDIDLIKAENLAKELKIKPYVALTLNKLIWHTHLVVECASVEAVRQIALQVIKQNRDILIMSVGGLLGFPEIFELAKKNNRRIYIPSGAIGGIDALRAGSRAKIERITLTTRKAPQNFLDAPYIKEKGIDLNKIDGEVLLFEGSVEEAIKGFPQNINVSAILSLAGTGSKEMLVRIVASPYYTRNIHEIEFEGSFGKFSARIENLPMPENPKTSYLAALSAIATLEKILENVKIGT
ncbi:MAG: aspartate dehydrogenase [Candidatus Omnitrophica bacterium]|nr:aspartate dehydrogenase [Candidatus Omnitrophota bacterium]MCM8798479.1 aspartate dehydrogenase [Candidatus Omnitrophota bacterium]